MLCSTVYQFRFACATETCSDGTVCIACAEVCHAQGMCHADHEVEHVKYGDTSDCSCDQFKCIARDEKAPQTKREVNYSRILLLNNMIYAKHNSFGPDNKERKKNLDRFRELLRKLTNEDKIKFGYSVIFAAADLDLPEHLQGILNTTIVIKISNISTQ